MESAFIESEVKFALEITCNGFDMGRDAFEVFVMKGHNVVKTYQKSDLKVDGDVYLVCVDTSELGTGNFDLAVKAYVPDTHFEDGYRTEIAKVNLLNVKKI